MPPMKQRILKAVTVRFEEPVRTALEEIAQREHRTLSDQIRHLVATALERTGEERAA
jgi:predicted transcriptional regulator